MSLRYFVCVYVDEHLSVTICPVFTKFLSMLPKAVAQFSSDSIVTCYMLKFQFMDDILLAHRLEMLH